jgi:hypothetical protein
VKEPLDDLVSEARDHLGTPEVDGVDWAAVDESLFARIDAEQREERGRFAGRRRPWPGVVAAAVAAAAVFALAMHDGGTERAEQGRDSLAAAGDEGTDVGGRIVDVEGDSRVLVDGHVALRGATIRLGDVVEVEGVGALVERPGKLTMRIEGGSRAAVTHTDGALVLALSRGAVEAQVVPIPRGEAFAVDVDGSRVAVHGTHLRVARSGDYVTVDLNEGVVAVGNAPRVGSVVGSLVTAPAHAEFAALNLSGSLSVSHDAAGVRAPIALGPAPSPSPVVEPPRALVEAPAPPSTPSPVAVRPATPTSRGEARPASSTAPVAEPASSPAPEQALEAAVRACMDQRPHAENITVLVSTTLHLDLGDDGAVRAARFDPPVAPDVNACAAPVIYRTRFAHGGSASIQVDFSN